MESSSNKATAGDAMIVLELVKMFQTERMRDATKWFFMDFKPKNIKDYVEFKRQYPDGSDTNRTGDILWFFEVAGAFLENGVLNEDLLFDVIPPVSFFWEALKPVIYGSRAEMKEDRIGENFELLAIRHEKWEKSHPPKVTRLVTA